MFLQIVLILKIMDDADVFVDRWALAPVPPEDGPLTVSG